MINLRLDENSIDDLLNLVKDKYPLTEDIAKDICKGTNPVDACTQVYGCYNVGVELVAIMTATYFTVFPHEDGTRVVHISGAYTREDMRGNDLASILIQAIEDDARKYFHADYLCCDSVADELYLSMGFEPAPSCENRLWKRLS